MFYPFIFYAMATKQKEKKVENNKAALFIPAGLVLGIGCGFILNNVVAAMFVGLGAGMIVYAVLTFIKK